MAGNWLRRGTDFVTRDVWRIRARELPRFRAFWVRALRAVILAVRGFRDDNCHLEASSLTYFSLLSVVPVVALGFGIAKGFRLEQHLDGWLRETFTGQEEIYKKVTDFANSLLENTSGGLIAGVGLALLFWTVIKLLGHVERSFNKIWGLKDERPFGRKLADYTLALLLALVLFIVSSSFNVMATRRVDTFIAQNGDLDWLDDLLRYGLKLLPFVAIWILFTFLYVYLPNTRVRISSGLLGGVVAGTVFQLLQGVYIAFQVSMANYNAVYGSFAALPLFLMWLQLSWLVVLLGAEIAFGWQNAETFEFESDCLAASPRFRSLVALRITHLLVKSFVAGSIPLMAVEIARQIEVPIRLAREIIFELVGAGILLEARKAGAEDMAYQVGRPPDQLTVGYVLKALADRGAEGIPLRTTTEVETLAACIRKFEEEILRSPTNVRLGDL